MCKEHSDRSKRTAATSRRYLRNFADQNAMADFLKNTASTSGVLQFVALGAATGHSAGTLTSHPNDLTNRRMILDRLDHEIGYIRTRDSEAEPREVAFSDAILSRVRLVGEFRRAHHRPLESALVKDLFHRGSIGYDARK